VCGVAVYSSGVGAQAQAAGKLCSQNMTLLMFQVVSFGAAVLFFGLLL
jgi:hypothetical protein